ncbi:hypothetical protein [Hymenobacter psoromatis]|uniref:hypothetical protein n=1 Tax=Hymenobacter psoromatis TaxID=1484116 RepID=UPI001CBB8136|nr:hypothetical protein [Hymenobacter psoromatis]
MRKPKLIEDYSYLLVDSLSPFAHSAARQTATSAFIASGGVLSQPLTTAVDALDANVAAIDYPTPAQTANRDLLRLAVTTELGRLAKRLNLDYTGQEPALLSSGLTLMAAASTAATSSLDTEMGLMDFDLLDGTQPGCLLLKLKRPTGTIQNLIRYTIAEDLDEDQWSVAVGGGRERQLGPFKSGTRVWVKVAALQGATTDPQYAGVKTRIVQ